MYLTNPRVVQNSCSTSTLNPRVDGDGVFFATSLTCGYPDTYDLTTSAASDTVQVRCPQVRRALCTFYAPTCLSSRSVPLTCPNKQLDAALGPPVGLILP